MKISIKLTLIMTALCLFIIGALGISLLYQAKKNITKLSSDKALALAGEYAAELEDFFSSNWYTAQTLVRFLEQYESIEPKNRRSIFNSVIKDIIRKNPQIFGIWCIWEPDALEGNDALYTNVEGTSKAGVFSPYWYRNGNQISLETFYDFNNSQEDDFYRTAINAGAGAILEPYSDTIGGRNTLMNSITEVIKKDGKIIGAIGVDFTADEIQAITQDRSPFGSGFTAVFTNGGIVASHFDTARIGLNMRETETDMGGPFLDGMINAVKDGRVFSFSNYVEAVDTELNVILSPINIATTKTPWSYAVAVPQKTVMEPVIRMEITAIMIGIFMLILVIPAAIFLARSISTPIVKITDALRDISQGEGDLTQTIAINSKDEIGRAAYFFNQTLDKIRKLVISIKKEIESLSITGADLAGNMEETASATHEINSNVQNIKGRIINQSASVSQTNATMDQITGNISRLNGHVERQSSSVIKASSAIEEMLANIQSVTNTLIKNADNVNELKEASETGRISLQNVAQDIQEITRESEGLMEINSVMENIASQTNLLSMNAAIEAAHAGEAGKGFAVVADEIRKLAESSGEQSKTIGMVLKKIASSIVNITHSAEIVLNRFEAINTDVNTVAFQEENIRGAMEEQGHGSKQILEAISLVKDITGQVKSSSQEMLEGSKEIITESKNLEKTTQEITSGMNEMAIGTEQINIAIHHVNDISVKNRINIDNLIKEISRFKV